ncbi:MULTISPECIES: cytolethal distending toxin subunit B family protein [unclassified Vibrio]|uniref:cytolethal distending toxin subunit B family protein n=1 Tax=unclassified Vibrio TaxID=2614977 RepID=UPI0014826DEB|nr:MULTISPECIES: cytolethal distending toxin subunit B family protein [unclassified Vibrio]MDQ2192865.1 cytolethal distending toxin subunit B family protein [Vibrio sp. A14(2019)]MDQ2197960.1 cytolethal distending toxin subunit B family protein [Vibrio sp. 2017_1457_11]NNN75961.1 cytolethal distending toxin subunit B family protein [Vibrio sp. B7]NNN93859.1 cytolethal distending toxin subunit B family protein [Vibrio sp. B8-1]NNO08221.1 cytolethal distending toxin subunit B family protein [Vib
MIQSPNHQEFEWNLGTQTRPNMRYIYYAQWDVGAGRVNPAIVTDRPADEIVALQNPVIQNGRPVLGVGFNRAAVAGRDFFFTLHASATGGGDARSLLESIHNHFGALGDRNSQWMVMGDYNQDPTVLQRRIDTNSALASNVSIVTQQQRAPTQLSGGNLDYSVLGQYDYQGPLSGLLVASMFIAQLHGTINSDHVPVKFFPK